MITIRPATYNDLPEIMPIYNIARDFMRSTGNDSQWVNGYPTEQFISEEIKAGHSFVCENSMEKLQVHFVLLLVKIPLI